MVHLIINKSGRVVNRIIWEGAEFLPPRDHTVKRCDCGQIGDYWDEDSDCYVTPVLDDAGNVSLRKRISVNGKAGLADLEAEVVSRWEHIKDEAKKELVASQAIPESV